MIRKFFHRFKLERASDEKGQSIVIIAFTMIGILAFVGLAVDVGFVFARSSQLQSAIDSAALAGVTELSSGQQSRADAKARQFLSANNIPDEAIDTMQTHVMITPIQATQYAVTVTWPVELFFLKVIGRDTVNVTKTATAAYFPLADVYASRRAEQGALTTSNQSIFGPNICTDFGDPFSPWNSQWAPGVYKYQYRILIPSTYPSDIVRVELFDPDSINQSANSAAVGHTITAINLGKPAVETKTCTLTSQRDNCLLDTGERSLYNPNAGVPEEILNYYWFMRIDENRGTGGGNGNGTCGQPANYTPVYNTQTLYQLYYYAQNSDGTIQRIDLSRYTGQVGDNARDTGNHNTDLRWVSPGGLNSFDQTTAVPTDPGSPKTFEISLSADVPNILTDLTSGNRYIYLEVTALSGASENGYEVWAGPRDYVNNVPSDVNARNVYLANNPGSHGSGGATVYALGRLPMNSNESNRVEIPLIYVGPEFIGQSIYVSLFDADVSVQRPITFYFDSISKTDWQKAFAVASGSTDPDGVASNSRCIPNCNNQWVNPAYEIKVPGNLAACDYTPGDIDDCTPFYGGRLMVSYQGGLADTIGWQISLSGLPYLVK